MSILTNYNLAGLTEDDALQVAKAKRDEARVKFDKAQAAFREWDAVYDRLLTAWAKKHVCRIGRSE